MPRKSEKDKKKEHTEDNDDDPKLMICRPKREASKNVSKIVASIAKDEDIITSGTHHPVTRNQKVNSAFTNFSPISFINTAYSKAVNKILSNIPFREEQILNKYNIERLVADKFKKYGTKIELDADVVKFLNHEMNKYIKTILEKLISVTRTRNVNFNLFSRNTVTGNSIPSYKINTYNWEFQNNNKGYFVPYKQFQILFTQNIKNDFHVIEEYHSLNSKKIELEKIMFYKNKVEEIEKEKGREANIKFTSGPNPIKLGPGRRTRKKDSAIIKTMRNNFVKSQKKEDFDRQKSFTMNTLDTFLDNSTKVGNKSLGGTMSNMRFDAEISSNKNESHFETYTKLSEISKSEYNHNFIINDNNNEVSVNVFKSNDVIKAGKLLGASKRKISLKDFIFFLENEMKLPMKMLMLQKAMIKISQLNQNNHLN